MTNASLVIGSTKRCRIILPLEEAVKKSRTGDCRHRRNRATERTQKDKQREKTREKRREHKEIIAAVVRFVTARPLGDEPLTVRAPGGRRVLVASAA